ncbi:hypothetical protein DRE_04439 [Drechslerella stenobrocha 248]|uniref:WW domain-containing protein n=1 Tax=Drechslerella stenobrocha 248 TaxID=1043628 RepID=W7I1Y2_9PEZI|nr:hypothetical protein DRE_04439 [Drechslerella stenobrocha 248]
MAGRRGDELFIDTENITPGRMGRQQRRDSVDGANLAAQERNLRQEPPLPRMRRTQTQPMESQLPYPDRPAAEREQLESHMPLRGASASPPAALQAGPPKGGLPAPPAFRASRAPKLQPAPAGRVDKPVSPMNPGVPEALNPYPEYHQQYWPPQAALDRSFSTASNMTVTARRGSPAPPETPEMEPSEVFSYSSRGPSRPNPAPDRAAPALHYSTSQASTNSGAIPILLDPTSPSLSQASSARKGTSRASQVFGSQGSNYDEDDDATPVRETPPNRPWTPTEPSGAYDHGPLTSYRGAERQDSQRQQQPQTQAHAQPQPQPQPQPQSQMQPQQQPQQRAPQHPSPAPNGGNASRRDPLEGEFSKLNVGDDAPPAYDSLAGPGQAPPNNAYPTEKPVGAVPGAAVAQQQPQGQASPAPIQHQSRQPTTPQSQGAPQGMPIQHPGGVPQPQQVYQQQIPNGAVPQQAVGIMPPGTPQQQQQQLQQQQQQQQQQGYQLVDQKSETITTQYVTLPDTKQYMDPGPASPPPLPDGWMSHLDQASGQYYYIHIPTQRTQWEFPAPETGISLMSGGPVSPGFGPMSPGVMSPGLFSEAMMSPAPSTFGMQMALPPPTPAQVPINIPGVSMFKVAPSNGVYFGPHLRYTNMDLEQGIWLGSILLVTAVEPPTIHLHQTIDLSPNPRQLEGHPIFAHKNWTFYRYDIDIRMGDAPAKWTYAVTSVTGCTRYEFLVAAKQDRSWRFIAHSCNDFSPSIPQQERSKLGGPVYMWKDVMQKHIEVGGFHCQIGTGNQVYADRMWKEIPLLKDWLDIKGKDVRKDAPWTARHEEDVQHAYFHYYTSTFDQPHVREAWAQIPHICQLDSHDIFDGFGSYPEYMQFSNMFKNIGRIAIDWYLLFQHHTTLSILRAVPDDRDLFTVTGTGWHFVKYLGPGLAVVGPDTRSERNPHQVMAGPTYQGLFPRIATLPSSVQHVLLMLSVPILFPRMDMAESVANTMQTGKKAVNGLFNMTGKVAGGVAGIVGAKGLVGEGFSSVKKAVGKTGMLSNVVSIFGEVDLLDDLRDHWTHQSKDLERTYLIRTLQGIAHARGIRFTFLSGDVQCCGAGLVHDPSKPGDHKTMYQIISSAIVNGPPAGMMMKLLNNNRQLFIPQNGMRSTNTPSDTKEDMIDLFATDINGTPRAEKKLMARRNYTIFAAYEANQQVEYMHQVPEKYVPPLSLAVDFIVQGDGVYSTTSKYGPIVIPRCEYGY